MLASERNLTTAHQSHNQPQRRQQNGVRSRNGTVKPAVRPVKIIVIDPRKLQQRLEAYVGEKERKQAEAEAEKLSKTDSAETLLQATQNKADNETLPSSSSTPVKVAVPTTPPKALPSSTKIVQTKVLPTLAPKLSAVSQAAVNCTVAVTQAGTLIGNGVTALQCISSGSIGLPLVVTNGVALIQPPISQSSIQPNGIFLPGITAIPNNVIATNSAAFIGPATATQVKSKSSTSQKKKVKKRKKAKKRKFSEVDEKEKEAEDAELAYLLKEPTTTRTGRISKPVSQPHSPAFASLPASCGISSPSTAVSRSPLKVKKKKSRPEIVFRCEICLKVCVSQGELKSHFEEFPHHKADPVLSQSQYPTSTNDQGTAVSTSQLALRTNIKLSQTLNSTTTTITSLSPTVSETSCTLQGSISSTLPIGNFQSNAAADSFISFTTSAKTTKRNDFFYAARSSSNNNYHATNDTVTVSLVPSSATDEADNLFLHCKSSNVDVVPSSYSVPSSPPSQCQSPGLPENSDVIHIPSKLGSGSPERICNSPVDPMLLRSRSPFPPPIPDSSLQPVSVSNLSIPEESLCKGELFMDLGEGILENMEPSGLNQLNVMSISQFCNQSSAPPLYTNASSPTPAKGALQGSQSIGEPSIGEHVVTSPISTSHVVRPVLLETTEDANDGEIFQSTNYARKFVHSSISSPVPAVCNTNGSLGNIMQQKAVTNGNVLEFPKTPLSTCIESDASMDSSETVEPVSHNSSDQKRRNVWQFVKEQIKICGIRQAVGEISEMAEKLSRIARDQFIPIREDEMDRMGNSASVIHVDSPFFSHLLDLPFGTYVFKEDAGRRRRVPPPPPLTSELSFTGGVEDVEKFLPPDIDLISLPHLTNLDLI